MNVNLFRYLSKTLCYLSIFSTSVPLSVGAFTVINTNDSGAGSLRQAILDANANGTNSTITFTTAGTIVLASSLPPMGSNIITVDTAGNAVTVNGGNLYQGFFVVPAAATALTISNNLTFLQTASIGGSGGGGGNGAGGALGAGGGLFVGTNATVNITGLTFTTCLAQGGSGGNGATGVTSGGGGGGMASGQGGSSTSAGGGGGGGGYGFNGGSASGGGGGGGGSDATVGGTSSTTAGANGGTGSIGTGGTGGATGSPGGAGGAGTGTSGGGGGGLGTAGSNGGVGGSVSGLFGGGGGGGNSTGVGGSGGHGGTFSGGGGSGNGTLGGTPGFGGGGGGGGSGANGAGGGFGGGGGGGTTVARGGFDGGAGGSGGTSGNAGGGGGGLGGALFIQNGGSLRINDPFSLSGNTVTAGSGGTGSAPGGSGVAGTAASSDLFMMSGGTVSFFPAGTLVISSNISSDQGLGGGSGGGLIMGGTGVLQLSGTNNYSGTTFLNAGTLQVFSDLNLGSTSSSTPTGLQFGGGALQISAPGSFSSRRTVNFSSSGTIDTDSLVTATFTGVISGAGAITVSGLGTLVFANPGLTSNSFSGPMTIDVGSTLQISTLFGFSPSVTTVNDNGSFVFSQTADLVIAANIGGTGALSMQGTSGTLELTGTNTYGGVTSITGGTLQIDTSASFPSANTSGVINNSAFVFDHPTGTATVAGPISGTGTLTMEGGSPAILALSGDNSYEGVTTISSGTLQINAFDSFPVLNTAGVVNSGSFVFNHPTGTALVVGPITGTGSLTMQGGSPAILALAAVFGGANTYTGPTTVTSGTLSINTPYSLPSGANVTVSPGATLAFNDPVSEVIPVTGNITGGGALVVEGIGTAELSGTNSYGSLTISSGAVQIDQPASLPGAASVTDNGILSLNLTGTVTIPNGISGSGSVQLINSGTLTFSGVNSYLGGTSISGGGTIKISNNTQLGNAAGSITFNNGTLSVTAPLSSSRPIHLTGPGSGTMNTNGHALTFSGVIDGSAPFTITGGGSLTLNTATNTFSGATTIGAGVTLNITNPASFPSTNSASWSNSGALVFNYASGTANVAASIAGTGTLTLEGGGNLALSGMNTYTGTTTISAGVMQVNGNQGLPTLSDVVNNGTLNFNYSTGTGTVSGLISGSGSVNVTSGGTLVLTNSSNSYGGGTSISGGGVISITSDHQLGSSATSVTLNNGTLDILLGPVTSNRMFLLNGPGAISVDAGTATLGASSSITGIGSFTKQGVGTLVLQGTNTYSGLTTITAGTLQIDQVSSLSPLTTQIVDNASLNFNQTGSLTVSQQITGTGSVSLINSGTLILGFSGNLYSGGTTISGNGILQTTSDSQLGLSSAMLTFDSGTLDIPLGTTSYISSRPISLVGAGIFSIDDPAGIATMNGSISGSSPLTLQGPGTLVLAGSNGGYTGNTTISSGTLQINNAISYQSPGTVLNNGAFIFSNASGTASVGGAISGTGSLTMNGAGTLTLGGLNSYSGPTTITTGTLLISSQNGLSPFSTVTDNGTLAFNNTVPVTVGNNISGSGKLTMQGTSTLILTGNNTGLTGTTTITSGTLQVNTASSLPSSTQIIDNGVLSLNFTGTNTLNGVVSGTGSVALINSGTLSLNGANTYSGGTLISGGGTIQGLGLGTGPITFNSGTWNITSNYTSLLQAILLTGPGIINVAIPNTATLGSLSGTGAFTKTGSGILILEGANSFGPLTISAGTLQFNNTSNALLTSGITNNASLIFNTTAALVQVQGDIVGSGNLTASGTGTLELSGNNTYLGATTIVFPAVLQIDTPSSLPVNSPLTDNGTLSFNLPAPYTFAGLISGTGGVNLINAGPLTLSNASNSYSGGTGISGGGTIVWGADSELGALTGSITLNNGTLDVISSLTSARPFLLTGIGPNTINTNSNTVTFSGNMTGTGPLTKQGSGTLILQGSNNFGSVALPITISAGTLQFNNAASFPGMTSVVDNGLLVFNHSGTINAQEPITGTGSLTMQGAGTLILSGSSTYSGPTTVQTGILTVDGSITSNVFVAVGATLSGIGTIFGNVTIDGASAPGNSIGTITGNTFLFNPGSSYDLEFNNTTADLIVANNSVTIDGGKVILIPFGFTQPLVSVYPIINSPAIAVNTPFTLVNPLARYSFALQYTPTQVLLVPGPPIPFHVIVPSGVSKCFDALLAKNPSGLTNVVNVLDMQTPAKLSHSFKQMQPRNLSTIAFAEENVAERIRQVYTDHFFEERALLCPKSKAQGCLLWVSPFVERVRQHGHADLPGYLESFVGFSAAVDYRSKKEWMVTSGFSFAATGLNVPHGRTQANFTTYAASVGAAWTPASWFFDALASYLYSPIHVERKMHFSSPFTPSDQKVNLTAKHTEHSNQFLGHVAAGYLFKIKASRKSAVNIYPFANVDYQYLPQKGYREHGAGSLDLKVSRKKYDYLRPEGGLGIGYKRCTRDFEMILDFSTSYIHEFRFAGKETKSSFESSDCTFTTRGLLPENNLVSPEVRLRLTLPNSGFSILLGYHGEFGEHFSMNAGEMEFRLAF